jgi:hypothetical protein
MIFYGFVSAAPARERRICLAGRPEKAKYSYSIDDRWGNLRSAEGRQNVSNHFTGLSLGPPLGDQRLDLCDLYAFQAPADPSRTVLILNANPTADALHPDAIYRLNIDNDGDCLTDIAITWIYSKPQNGKQMVNVFVAKGA